MISTPQPGEYPPMAGDYIALAASYDIIQLLTDLKETTALLFTSLTAKADYGYAPGKWTVKEVLSHLIDTERIFAYRALSISRGEQQNLPGFEQNDYADNSEAAKRNFTDLIEEYQAVRLSNLYLFRSLTTEQANRIGLSRDYPTSVRALAYMTAGHELHHLNILKERYL